MLCRATYDRKLPSEFESSFDCGVREISRTKSAGNPASACASPRPLNNQRSNDPFTLLTRRTALQASTETRRRDASLPSTGRTHPDVVSGVFRRVQIYRVKIQLLQRVQPPSMSPSMTRRSRVKHRGRGSKEAAHPVGDAQIRPDELSVTLAGRPTKRDPNTRAKRQIIKSGKAVSTVKIRPFCDERGGSPSRARTTQNRKRSATPSGTGA